MFVVHFKNAVINLRSPFSYIVVALSCTATMLTVGNNILFSTLKKKLVDWVLIVSKEMHDTHRVFQYIIQKFYMLNR